MVAVRGRPMELVCLGGCLVLVGLSCCGCLCWMYYAYYDGDHESYS